MIKALYTYILNSILLFLLFNCSASVSLAANFSKLYSPLPALTAKELGVIVNDSDPLSIRIAKYYQQQRKIPEQNIIHIKFSTWHKVLPVSKFKQIKKTVDKLTPKHVQAYALTWMQPYRVGCMSITTAFAAGYNELFCARGCKQTLKSPYFNSELALPFAELNWRPTMALAGENFAEVKALIDRGVASDYSHPMGTAYLLTTSDKARSTRSVLFPSIARVFSGLWPVETLKQDAIENKQDVMFILLARHMLQKFIQINFCRVQLLII
jgi:uncharacterized protein (TIGR03790 family)